MIGNIESPATSSDLPTGGVKHLPPVLLLIAAALLIAGAFLSGGVTGAAIVLWGEVVLALTCAMR